MAAGRSRWLLGVSLLGCACALLVALVVGSWSQADDAPPQGAPVTPVVPAPTGREVPSLRTEFSRTYQDSDGVMRASISSVPVNYRDAAGDWRPIDTTLRSDGQGGLEPAGTAGELSLPGDLSEPAKVGADGRWVSFSLDGASSSATADSSGATATYDDALPSVDASYRALSDGVKETLTLADASAPATYRYAIDTSSGLHLVLRAAGDVEARDADGATRFVLPAPTVQEAGQAEPSTDHVAYRLSDDGSVLSVVVDPAWLAGARFPVRVDPTIYRGDNISCTLDSGAATTSSCNGAALAIGHDTGSNRTYRSAFFFPTLNSDVPQTASIIGAHLGVQFTGITPSTSAVVDAVGLSPNTLTSSATWNSYDGSHAWGTAGGDLTSSVQPSPTTLRPDYLNGWVTWDVSRLAESWVRDDSTNHGVLLKLHDETSQMVLNIGGHTYSGGGPTLDVEYELHPGFERDQQRESIGLDDRSGLSVGLSSGNLAVSSDDVHLPGVAGMDLDVARTFNGANLGDGSTIFGSAWTETIDGAETINGYDFLDDRRVIYGPGNAIYRFDRDYANPANDATHQYYLTPPGIDADLVVNPSDETSTLTYRQSGMRWIYLAPYNDQVRLSQLVDRHGNTITLSYSSTDPTKVDHIVDTYGRTLQFTYNWSSNGQLTRITDATGRQWGYTTDTSSGHNVLTGFTNPDGKTTTYTYATGISGVWDKLTKITDARGHDTSIVYGSNGDGGQPTQITRAVDTNSAHNVVWNWNYTPASGTGHACTSSLQPVGSTVETDPEGHVTTYCYNKNGQVIETFDANGRSVQSTYNAQANVATFTGLAGTGNAALSTYTFSSANSSNATKTETDVNVGTSTSPVIRPETTTATYCGNGSESACSSSYALARYEPVTSTDTQGTQQGYTYNSSGDLTTVNTTSGSDNQTLGYDSAGNVTSSRDGNANTTTYTWTSNFLTRVDRPTPLQPLQFSPDGLDRVKWAKDGMWIFSCVTYDGEDRVTRVDYKTGVTDSACSTGTTAAWMTYIYDADGNLTQRADSGGNTTTYGYDYANRRVSETFPSSRSNTYTYDRAGNLSSLVDNDGTTTYAYDPANRLRTVTSPKPGGGTDTITYAYADPSGTPSSPNNDPSKVTITFPGGLQQQSVVDAAGNITSIHVLNAGGTVLDKRDYSYQTTVAGQPVTGAQIQSVADGAGSTTAYTYGAANRLIRAAMTGTTSRTWNYAYDYAGNRTLRQVTSGGTTTNTYGVYNAANELCYTTDRAGAHTCGSPPSGSTTYSYDNEGQRTSGPTAAYDNLERLTTLTGTSLSYLSPGNGELVSYGSTNYQNNLLGVGRIIPSSGSATDLIRTPYGATLAQRVGTTTKQDLFTDALGSTIDTADDGATSLAKTYTYDPDGNATSTGTGTTPSVLYAGGLQIGGLYHYGARYYDPNTATWTQQDPLNQISSLTQANRFAYVGGDSINEIDPTGLGAAPCVGGRRSPAGRNGNPELTDADCAEQERESRKGSTAASWITDLSNAGTCAIIGAANLAAGAVCGFVAVPVGHGVGSSGN